MSDIKFIDLIRSNIEDNLKSIKYDDTRIIALKKIDPNALLTIEDSLKYKISKLVNIFYDFNLKKKKIHF